MWLCVSLDTATAVGGVVFQTGQNARLPIAALAGHMPVLTPRPGRRQILVS